MQTFFNNTEYPYGVTRQPPRGSPTAVTRIITGKFTLVETNVNCKMQYFLTNSVNYKISMSHADRGTQCILQCVAL